MVRVARTLATQIMRKQRVRGFARGGAYCKCRARASSRSAFGGNVARTVARAQDGRRVRQICIAQCTIERQTAYERVHSQSSGHVHVTCERWCWIRIQFQLAGVSIFSVRPNQRDFRFDSGIRCVVIDNDYLSDARFCALGVINQRRGLSTVSKN